MDHPGMAELMLDPALGKMAAELAGVDGIRICRHTSAASRLLEATEYVRADTGHVMLYRRARSSTYQRAVGKSDRLASRQPL